MSRLYNWLTDPQRNPKIIGSRLNDEFDNIFNGGITASTLATSAFGQYVTMVNGTITTSVASNILTVNVKTLAGADPSATDPVWFVFRNATIATGDYTAISVTSALTITTNATGATLGTANTVPFRLWVVAFNNGGAVVLALWQSVTGGASPTAVAPLNEAAIASSTAISGSATAAGTFYTPNGTTVTSKSFRIIAYLDYASGLATAGTYVSAPTTVQLFGPGIKKPGETVQSVFFNTTSQTNVTSSTMTSTSVTASIAPSSAPNIIKYCATGSLRNASAATSHAIIQMFRGSTALNSAVDNITNGTVGPASLKYVDAPGTTSSTTYTVKLSSSDNASQVSFPFTGTAPAFGTLTLDEVMV